MPAPLAGLATFLFCAYLALFPAAAGGLRHASAPGRRRARCSSCPRSGRSPSGCAAGSSPVSRGSRRLLAGAREPARRACAGARASTASRSRRARGRGRCWRVVATTAGRGARAMPAAAADRVAVVAAGGLARQQRRLDRAGRRAGHRGLLQGNVPQDTEVAAERRSRPRSQTTTRRSPDAAGALIVLPETALPALPGPGAAGLPRRAARARARNGGDVLIGVPSARGRRGYYNSVVSLRRRRRRRPTASRTWCRSASSSRRAVRLGPRGAADPADRFRARRAGRSSRSRSAGQRVAVNICYEDVFGEEIIRQLPQATLLVNVSNDAWFGDSLAADAAPADLADARARDRALHAARDQHRRDRDHRRARARRRPAAHVHRGRARGTAQGRTGATPYVVVATAAAARHGACWRCSPPVLVRDPTPPCTARGDTNIRSGV